MDTPTGKETYKVYKIEGFKSNGTGLTDYEGNIACKEGENCFMEVQDDGVGDTKGGVISSTTTTADGGGPGGGPT
ncbi:MAG: hypothetical protein ABEK36_02920, partial [Candidatus Aenigmatarchaeota archaeon]